MAEGMTMGRSLMFFGLLILGCVARVHAEMPDMQAQMALYKFQNVASKAVKAEFPATLHQQASYLKQVRNGLVLYRDGLLNDQDIRALGVLVEQQISTAQRVGAIGGISRSEEKLVALMVSSGVMARDLLTLDPKEQAFKQQMDDYQNGVGNEAYRYADEIGIMQL